jgi:outer membrane protein assembly factor BamD (BamD/ComL family)
MRRLFLAWPVALVARGILALALLLAFGCSSARGPVSVQRTPPEAERLVARADALAEAGEGGAAQYLYQQVLREFPEDPAVPAALYALGRLETDPAGGVRNYRAAYGAFTRLVTEYPGSRWATDARAWQAALGDLLAYEEATARIKLQLRWREEEAAGLRLQIQQLKSVDIGLERRR